MLEKIKQYASVRYLLKQAQELGITLELEYDKTLLKTLSELLPETSLTGEVTEVETNAKEAGEGYYPYPSYYRVCIQYWTNEGGWKFKNCTVHYDKHMNFISVQGHHQEGYGEIFALIGQIFNNLR